MESCIIVKKIHEGGNNMKTIYQTPELEILETAVDVITASTPSVGHKQNQEQDDYDNEVVDWSDIWG